MSVCSHTAVAAFVLMLVACGAGDGTPSRVEISAEGEGFSLLLNSNRYRVKGAAGNQYLDKLIEIGGNSVRLWDVTYSGFGEAPRFGLTVTAGIPVGKPGTDVDYSDRVAVAVQFERAKQAVRRLKDHPALLMWALGNEAALGASAEDRGQVWDAVEELAQMVKREDPNHPVMAVIAGTGIRKVAELVERCPSLDAIGVNVYGNSGGLPQSLIEQGWNKPYLVTQLGPRGDWQVDNTSWGAPLEDDTTSKAGQYRDIYERAVRNQPNCLGAYAYFWGDRRLRTHTWFGMFLPDGSPTAAVDVMAHTWSGRWPINRAPEIGEEKVTLTLESASQDDGRRQFLPGATVHAHVDASDPDEDPLIVRWEVRRDVLENDEPSTVVPEAVRTKRHTRAVMQTPDTPGSYRLFVYVYDPQGSAATINVPFIVVEGR